MSPVVRYAAIAVAGVSIMLLGGDLGILLFLVFMGGVLAYLGDQLGIYWGKKRVSIFGMRPKNTAMAIGVVTGLVITLLTLMGASYFNENFRIALFQTQSLKLEKEGLVREQRALLDVQTELRRQQDQIMQDNRSLQASKAELLKSKGDLERKVGEIEETLLQLQEDKRRKIAEVETLTKVVEQKETALVAVNKGQPLLETPILVPFTASRDAINKIVSRMLADLRQAVETFGVTIDHNAFPRAESQLTDSIMGKLQVIRDACRRDGLQVFECSVQPIATRNVSLGESLQSVNFEVKPNLLVFRKDEEVARTTLDGRLAEERILDQLFYFDRQVLSVLAEKGVSSNSLRVRTRKISAPQLVNFYRIVELVRQLARPVLVRFVTLAPINSYGEIDAIYKVEDLPGAAASVQPSVAATSIGRFTTSTDAGVGWTVHPGARER